MKQAIEIESNDNSTKLYILGVKTDSTCMLLELLYKLIYKRTIVFLPVKWYELFIKRPTYWSKKYEQHMKRLNQLKVGN